MAQIEVMESHAVLDATKLTVKIRVIVPPVGRGRRDYAEAGAHNLDYLPNQLAGVVVGLIQ